MSLLKKIIKKQLTRTQITYKFISVCTLALIISGCSGGGGGSGGSGSSVYFMNPIFNLLIFIGIFFIYKKRKH